MSDQKQPKVFENDQARSFRSNDLDFVWNRINLPMLSKTSIFRIGCIVVYVSKDMYRTHNGITMYTNTRTYVLHVL